MEHFWKSKAPGSWPNAFRHTKLAAALAIGAAIAPWGASGQSNVDGRVSGTTVPGLSVELKGLETGQSFTVTADSEGNFRFNAVPAGRYIVTSGDARQEVEVKIGENSVVEFQTSGTTLDDIVVTGTSVAPIDVAQTESAFNIGERQFDAIPIPRNITGLALLAPGTVQGDDGFGDLASFGGATVSENQYFLNGFNISDLRTRLGPSTVPFEFFDDFQVKTGGYSAEFGRSTGGVVNATSKRGTNVWKADASAFYTDPSWTEKQKDVKNRTSLEDPTMTAGYLYVNSLDEQRSFQANFSVGGPILRDRLFIYVLANLRNIESELVRETGDYTESFVKGNQFARRTESDPFGAIKLDWQIVDGHKLEFTGFSDQSTRKEIRYNFDLASRTATEPTGDLEIELGGTTAILRYSGQITDALTASALYGRLTRDSSVIPSNTTCPDVTLVADGDTTPGTQLGCFVGSSQIDEDERKAYRVDLQYYLGDLGVLGSHSLRIGADREDNTSFSTTVQSGGSAYNVYLNQTAGASIEGISAPADGDYVGQVFFANSGTIDEVLTAYYVEDNWQITSRLAATVGLRFETFELKNTLGQTFLDLESDVAPRLGLSFDVFGDGSARLYANYGEYSIPTSTQVAVRNGTGEFYRTEVYELEGYAPDATSTPITGEFVGAATTADGDVADPRQLVADGVEPSSQEEIILGFQSALPEQWFGQHANAGIRYIYRNLTSTLEDIAIDEGLNAVLAGRSDVNLQDCTFPVTRTAFACGFDFYFITNPGTDVVAYIPTDSVTGNLDAHGDGPLVPVSIPGSALGYPEPERKYHAVELTYEKAFGAKWFMYGSYTWSQSYGNYEGFVNSSIEQEDVAITQDFDQPGFTEGARGYLANDRRHKIKLFGAYRPTEEWNLGLNLQAYSGRPVSAYGFYPDLDRPEFYYAQFSFYTTHPDFTDGESVLVSRGSAGRTPWIFNVDLAVTYAPAVFEQRLKVGFDVFNLLDADEATEELEISELINGSPNPNYRTPVVFQDPRSLRLRMEYTF